jgi:hypothetical protein
MNCKYFKGQNGDIIKTLPGCRDALVTTNHIIKRGYPPFRRLYMRYAYEILSKSTEYAEISEEEYFLEIL